MSNYLYSLSDDLNSKFMRPYLIQNKPMILEFDTYSDANTSTPPVKDLIYLDSEASIVDRKNFYAISKRAYFLLEDLLKDSDCKVKSCLYEDTEFYLLNPFSINPKHKFGNSDHDIFPFIKPSMSFFSYDKPTRLIVNQEVYDRIKANTKLKGFDLKAFWDVDKRENVRWDSIK